jgi:hypothetical protein
MNIDDVKKIVLDNHGKMKSREIAKLAGISYTKFRELCNGMDLGFNKHWETEKEKEVQAKKRGIIFFLETGEKSTKEISLHIGQNTSKVAYYMNSMLRYSKGLHVRKGANKMWFYRVDNDAEIDYNSILPQNKIKAPLFPKVVEGEPIDTYKAMPAMIRALTPFTPHEHKAVKVDGVDFHNRLNGDKVKMSIEKNKQLHIDRQRTMRKSGAKYTGSTSMDI